MAKKNSKKNQDKEIWSRKFETNDDNENNKYSRAARKKAEGGISPILTSLFIFLALLIILPTATYLWFMNERSDAEEFKPDSDKITITQNSSSKESSSEKQDSSSEKTSVSVSEETSTLEIPAKSESKVEDEVIEEVPEQSVPKEEEAPETAVVSETEIEKPALEETGNTYTVVAGDNLYRIALNHGMTTDELKTINGISGNDVAAGTVLKVK
ncbi:LysM peptidoglycan-binding domain-containing protein [Carnobacterium funditum]|uniref:LysM peptidoglycan-binding domain-containing protein n=1 Tax=Carnobacterium funditum TaxID=2752 RepID=UPI0005551288|nr:LysM peptidoglycan-binding domain-containing protein [Carnobacterium funditum]